MKENRNIEQSRPRRRQIRGQIPTDPGRQGKQSRARQIQKNRETAERRKRINPVSVLSDPDVFFNDLIMEQTETM